MKSIFVVSVLLFSLMGYSQTPAEWGNQDRTQTRYLTEQIVALHYTFEFAAQGYKITKYGLNTIKKIKNGDFKLHRDFFESLSAVKPVFLSIVNIGDIRHKAELMNSLKRALMNTIARSNQLTAWEVEYCGRIFIQTNTAFDGIMYALLKTVSPGNSQMTDEARLSRMSNLKKELQAVYDFHFAFAEKIKLLSIQRLAATDELHRSKLLNARQ